MLKQVSQKSLNREQIKYFAVFAMLLNHIGNIFLSPGLLKEIFVDIGYFTAPTMLFFLVEGYQHTHSKKAYGERLLIFALLSQLPFGLAFTEEGVFGFTKVNMIFTLFMCFMIIRVHETARKQRSFWEFWIVCLAFSEFFDWSYLAPLFTVYFIFSEDDTKRAFRYATVSYAIITFVNWIGTMPVYLNLLRSIGATSGVVLSGFCITHLYNGQKAENHSKFSKWFFYIFYPAHLLILGLIRIKIKL